MIKIIVYGLIILAIAFRVLDKQGNRGQTAITLDPGLRRDDEESFAKPRESDSIDPIVLTESQNAKPN